MELNTPWTFRYDALLYIPSKAPADYYSEDFRPGLALYSSGILIMESCESLLPDYFNFVRGVVDSPDLSLNSEVSIYYDSNTGVYHYFIVSYQSTVDTVESTVYEEFYYDVNTDMYTSTPYLRVEHDTATGEDIYYEYASGGIWNEISSEAAETTITSVDTLGEAYHDFIWFDVITRDNLEGAYQPVG